MTTGNPLPPKTSASSSPSFTSVSSTSGTRGSHSYPRHYYRYPLLLLFLAFLFLFLCLGPLLLQQPAKQHRLFIPGKQQPPFLKNAFSSSNGLLSRLRDGFAVVDFPLLRTWKKAKGGGGGGGGGIEGAKGGGGGDAGRGSSGDLVRRLVERYRVDFNAQLPPGDDRSVWGVAEGWVTQNELLPAHAPELGAVLHALSTSPIRRVDNTFEGTQLKLLLTLTGGQRVVFKPKWYERDYIVEGPPYAGRDRHNGEVAAFHLSRLLEFRRTPLAVGRTISLTLDLLPSVPEDLMNTFYEEDGETCFYGRCVNCGTRDKENALCTRGGSDVFEGTVILWLPRHVRLKEGRNPWRRTYQEKLMARWEKDEAYCNIVRQIEPFVNNSRLLLDLIDVTVFDYLIGNADRHHYEVVNDVTEGMLVMLDNGKSFGNPYQDDRSILAPLYQCCTIRRKTWERLLLLQHGVLSGVLREVLWEEPLNHVLTEQHLQALDRRLGKVLQEVDRCVETLGVSAVLLSEN